MKRATTAWWAINEQPAQSCLRRHRQLGRWPTRLGELKFSGPHDRTRPFGRLLKLLRFEHYDSKAAWGTVEHSKHRSSVFPPLSLFGNRMLGMSSRAVNFTTSCMAAESSASDFATLNASIMRSTKADCCLMLRTSASVALVSSTRARHLARHRWARVTSSSTLRASRCTWVRHFVYRFI